MLLQRNPAYDDSVFVVLPSLSRCNKAPLSTQRVMITELGRE